MLIFHIKSEVIIMLAQNIQNKINEINYWDARVLKFEFSYFGDEIFIVFEDTDFNVKLQFNGCSKFSFVTSADDRVKPIRDLTRSQIPYFLQDIEVTDVVIGEQNLINCRILMPPLKTEILCSCITIEKI